MEFSWQTIPNGYFIDDFNCKTQTWLFRYKNDNKTHFIVYVLLSLYLWIVFQLICDI